MKKIKADCGNNSIETITVVSLIVLFIGIINYWVLSQDTVSPLHDANVCYSSSYSYYKQFIENFEFSNWKTLFSNINFYPPSYMLVPLPFYIFTGPDADIMAMINILYIYLLIWSIYKLGNFIFDRPAGLFAIFIILTFPPIIGFSRITHMNIALTAILTFNIYLLLKSDNFSSRKVSIYAGIVAGLGMLFSSKYKGYLAGPFFIYLIYSFLLLKSRFMQARKRIIVNIIFFLFIAVFISLPYLFSYKLQIDNPPVLLFFSAAAKGFKPGIFIFHLKEYIKLLKSYILMPNFLLFLLSLITSAFVLPKDKKSVVFIGWILLPLFILSFFAEVNLVGVQPRFLLPVLPAVALVISALFIKITKFFKVYFSKISVFLTSAFMLSAGTTDYIFFLREHPYPKDSVELLSSRTEYGLLHVVSKKFPVSNLFSFLAGELKRQNKGTSLVVIFEDDNDTAPLALELIYDYARKKEIDISLFTPMGLSIYSRKRRYSRRQNKNLAYSIFESANYVLYIVNDKKHHTMGRPEEYYYRTNRVLKKLFFSAKENMNLVWQNSENAGGFFTEELSLFHRKYNKTNQP